MPSQCERFTQSNIAKIVSQAMNKILEEHVARLCDFEKQIIVNYATKEYDGASFVCKK